MARLKRLLVNAFVETAKKQRRCSRNKGHSIPHGQKVLGHQGEHGEAELLP